MTKRTAPQIKLSYLTHVLSYESALLALEKVGYNAGQADDYLFARDIVWHDAEIQNGEIPARVARFDTSRYQLSLWLSPNSFGNRSCNTIAEATRLIKDSKVAQALEIE